MPTIEIEDAKCYKPYHQETSVYTKYSVKGNIYCWEDVDKLSGAIPIEIKAHFESGEEPYILIAAEGSDMFEPKSSSIKLTLKSLLSMMINWNSESENSTEDMADYLELLVKMYRRKK